MQTKTRMNVYFEPDLLKKVEALSEPRTQALLPGALDTDEADTVAGPEEVAAQRPAP